jgi:transposase-like protein
MTKASHVNIELLKEAVDYLNSLPDTFRTMRRTRRSWTPDQKRLVASEVLVERRSKSATARKHSITTWQVSQWCGEYGKDLVKPREVEKLTVDAALLQEALRYLERLGDALGHKEVQSLVHMIDVQISPQC